MTVHIGPAAGGAGLPGAPGIIAGLPGAPGISIHNVSPGVSVRAAGAPGPGAAAGAEELSPLEIQAALAVPRPPAARAAAAAARRRGLSGAARPPPPPPPPPPYKADTSRPSLRTDWTRLGQFVAQAQPGQPAPQGPLELMQRAVPALAENVFKVL